MWAPVSSAPYSRWREIDMRISAAASGAKMIVASRAMIPSMPPPSRLRPPPKIRAHCAIQARTEIAEATAAPMAFVEDAHNSGRRSNGGVLVVAAGGEGVGRVVLDDVNLRLWHVGHRC